MCRKREGNLARHNSYRTNREAGGGNQDWGSQRSHLGCWCWSGGSTPNRVGIYKIQDICKEHPCLHYSNKAGHAPVIRNWTQSDCVLCTETKPVSTDERKISIIQIPCLPQDMSTVKIRLKRKGKINLHLSLQNEFSQVVLIRSAGNWRIRHWIAFANHMF